MSVSTNTVLGKYRILREIARSNDIVYEAIDPTMARRVAVKELQLPPHLAGAQKRERIERFYREAKAAGTLSHPSIVTIHDVGQENDRHFLVMEYLEGQSLRDVLQMQGALPLKETVEITLQLCDALAYAHSRGVVHRDIKPDNVHILPGGIIKLTDFGIARITAEPSITSHGQVFGTPSYMSPEQVASHTVDHRTDLFSLGITLYEMLTGRKPFAGDSVITITYNIMNIQPTMPVGVPAALQQILQRALAKDPNARYQNAAAMAADLRAEKFALTAPPPAQAAHIPVPASAPPAAPLTFASGPPLTLNTGAVPPEISGMPAPPVYPPLEPTQSLPMEPDSPAAANTPAQPRRRRFSPETEKWLSLALPALGLLVLLALIVWGLVTVVSSLRTHARRAQAEQLTAQAAGALQKGDYQRAASAYAQAEATAPSQSDEATQARAGHSLALTAQGAEAARTNNLPAAEGSYQDAVALNAKNAAAWNALGNIRWQSGDTQGALQAWTAAVQADPSSPSGKQAQQNAKAHLMDMAGAAAKAGNVQAARDLWQQVTQIDPGSDEAFQAQQNISRTQPSITAPPGVGLPN